MFDQVTLKLNVDPLIMGALQEDIPVEDVSTNAVMPESCPGQVELICKEDGIICGLQIFARVFELLDETTKCDFFVHVELCAGKKGGRQDKTRGIFLSFNGRRAGAHTAVPSGSGIRAASDKLCRLGKQQHTVQSLL